MFLLAPFALMYLYQAGQQDKPSECEEMDRAEKMRGLYENKIRFFCGPEKIYEIFASNRNESGKLTMSYRDFYKAVTPYSYTSPGNTEDYFKRFKPKTLKIIDADGSGEIEFTEFFFFILLLQVPINTMRKQFNLHADHTMSQEEFAKTLYHLKTKTNTGHHSVEKCALDARQVSASEEEFMQTNNLLVEKIF
jgi:Ca2+-binding EF-hand superfamily protein